LTNQCEILSQVTERKIGIHKQITAKGPTFFH